MESVSLVSLWIVKHILLIAELVSVNTPRPCWAMVTQSQYHRVVQLTCTDVSVARVGPSDMSTLTSECRNDTCMVVILVAKQDRQCLLKARFTRVIFLTVLRPCSRQVCNISFTCTFHNMILLVDWNISKRITPGCDVRLADSQHLDPADTRYLPIPTQV